jgi:hypothetical protein
MTSTRSKSTVNHTRTTWQHCCYFLLCLVLLLWSHAAFAAEAFEVPSVPADSHEAWLVTFGPGEVYWEKFGHNAIWLREPAAGLDHTFNFGYFDFEQEDFFLRFLRGRMLYFSIAQPANQEFASYQRQNRSIRVQKLKLTPTQYGQLRDFLLNEIKPENRDYRYDYYLNNCSTRIRDALDIALDGQLSEHSQVIPANLNFRDQTRRLTQMGFWYYLGLELGLGFPVDREVSLWDEMFIPMVVADEIATISLTTGEADGLLVEVDKMLFTSSLPAPGDAPSGVWLRYLAFGLLVTGLAWLSGRFMPPVWLAGLCSAWILIATTIGLLLAALWLLTDHEVTRPNANLLLFNPLLILTLIPALRRFGAMVLAGGVIVSVVLLLLPQYQYNVDVFALVAPINLAVAGYFFKAKNLQSQTPN